MENPIDEVGKITKIPKWFTKILKKPKGMKFVAFSGGQSKNDFFTRMF